MQFVPGMHVQMAQPAGVVRKRVKERALDIAWVFVGGDVTKPVHVLDIFGLP